MQFRKSDKSMSNATPVSAEHGFLGLPLHYKFKVYHMLKLTVLFFFFFFLAVLVLVFHSFLHPSPCVIYN